MFYIILLYYSKVDQLLFLNASKGEIFRAKNEKKKALQPHTAQKLFLIAVTIADHLCWEMQKGRAER